MERTISKIVILLLSLLTLILALTVKGILKTLLIGLTLNTAYALIMIMTIFLPSLCRKSSATWTLLATMIALAAWLIFDSIHFFPHAIYFTWLVSIIVFFAVMVFDSRKISDN